MGDSRFSISIHILTLLAKANGGLLTSDYIAGSININPVLVRNELINLRKHNLVVTKEGKSGGAHLRKPAGEIYLSDVYRAVKQSDLLKGSKNKPNPHCPVGRQINTHLTSLFHDAENALLGQLGKVTLKKFALQFN
jgi:DNA-binding IscR family transcriptional regulator